MPGGALAPGEPAHVGAIREAVEEAGLDQAVIRVLSSHVLDHGPWSYTTVLAEVTAAGIGLEPAPTDPESLDVRWVDVSAVADLTLLPAFANAWPALRDLLGRRLVLVVDGAGVADAVVDDGVPATAFGLPGARWWPEVVPADGVALDMAADLQRDRPRDVVALLSDDPALRRHAEHAKIIAPDPASLR